MKKLMIGLIFVLPFLAMAQQSGGSTVIKVEGQPVGQAVEMADAMYENGKILVVVGVIAILFVGIFVYLLMTERKLSRLEKRLNQEGK